MPSFEPVTAVVRALSVLQELNKRRKATILDLHAATGLHKSTVLRMLETLMSEGFVVRLDGESRYAITGKCLLLSNGFDAHESLVRVAEPLRLNFRRRVSWPSDLAAYDYDAMVLLRANRDVAPGFLNRVAGSRTPMFDSSLGRAFFAFARDDLRNEIFRRVSQATADGQRAPLNRKAIFAMADEIRERGYAVPDGEYVRRVYGSDVDGFGLPVFDRFGVAGAVNVMFLPSLLPPAAARKTILVTLRELAESISESLRLEDDPMSTGDM